MSEFQCPGCRTPLALGVDACVGCGAPIAWSYCGACLAANAPGAATCVACKRSLQPSAQALPERFPCPRCEGAMGRRKLEGYEVHECSRCRGAFVDHLTLRRLETDDGPAIGVDGAPARMSKPMRPASPVVYIRCPGCADVMNRVQFGRLSGIVVDVCRQHGTFFDPQELERARELVSMGGLEAGKKGQGEDDKGAKPRKGAVKKKSGQAIPAQVVTSDIAMLAVARAIAHWLRGKQPTS